MEDRLACKALHRPSRLPERLATESTGVVRYDVLHTAIKVVINDSLVEGGDVVTPSLTQFEKETKQEILHKPDCSDISIIHDGTALYLNKASSVMEVYCNRGTSSS